MSHFQLNSGELLPVGQNIWYLDLGANIDWTTRRRLLPRNSQFSILSSQKLKFSILYSIFTKTWNTFHHVLYPHIKRFGLLVLTNGLQYSCNACLIEEANFRLTAKNVLKKNCSKVGNCLSKIFQYLGKCWGEILNPVFSLHKHFNICQLQFPTAAAQHLLKSNQYYRRGFKIVQSKELGRLRQNKIS